MAETPGVDQSQLEAAVDEYERTLEIPTVSQISQEPESILAVLLARDAIANALRGATAAEEATRLIALDEALRAHAVEWSDALPSGRLESWRCSFSPKPESWWWRLDEVPIEAAEKKSPWWPVFTAILLTVSASLTADIARRFLSGGPDFYGALSTISQGAVTVVAGSSLTQAGRRWLNGRLRSFGVRPERHPGWYTTLALCVLTVVGAFRLLLPWIAIEYDGRGQRLFAERKLHSAIEHFRRAISLAPELDRPHYDLADALEELLDVDGAISEYQSALQLNPDFYPAYNNLARLYLVKRKDYEGALRALRKGINRVFLEDKLHPANCPSASRQCEALYALHKNFAWVNVEKQWYRLARISADEAIKVKPDGSAAYCLLAQVEVAEGNHDAATANWGKCVGNKSARQQIHGDDGNRREEVEETWIAMAREWESKLKGVAK